jgi:hypothetical protein
MDPQAAVELDDPDVRNALLDDRGPPDVADGRRQCRFDFRVLGLLLECFERRTDVVDFLRDIALADLEAAVRCFGDRLASVNLLEAAVGAELIREIRSAGQGRQGPFRYYRERRGLSRRESRCG